MDILKIRFCPVRSLIFAFVLSSCFKSNEPPSSISIRWEKDRATGVYIPLSLLADTPEDSIKSLLGVHLVREKNQPAILGEWTLTDESVLFEPVIPFTRGLTYEVRLGEHFLGSIQIPLADAANAPVVMAVYPMADTLPHNLLKMYVQFSKSMQEGKVLNHIVLIKNDTDTVRSAFLDLQPELWNKDRTLLTLWLDPGRIKRDLQPNQSMGEPLHPGTRYRLLIQPDWQDEKGISLQQPYSKNFVVGQRDSLSPDLSKWTIQIPTAGSRSPVQILFGEPLDYTLLNHAVHFIDPDGNPVAGKVELSNQESRLMFRPSVVWKAGTYLLECEARLEDLAGNNLNRVFDRDINLVQSNSSKEMFQKPFRIQ